MKTDKEKTVNAILLIGQISGELIMMQRAFIKITSLWHDCSNYDIDLNDHLHELYPFCKSFDEMTEDVKAWVTQGNKNLLGLMSNLPVQDKAEEPEERYIVLDLFNPEWPNIVTDEEGKPLIFANTDEADIIAWDCQESLIVQIAEPEGEYSPSLSLRTGFKSEFAECLDIETIKIINMNNETRLNILKAMELCKTQKHIFSINIQCYEDVRFLNHAEKDCEDFKPDVIYYTVYSSDVCLYAQSKWDCNVNLESEFFYLDDTMKIATETQLTERYEEEN